MGHSPLVEKGIWLEKGGEGYCFATLGESVCTTNVAKCSKHIVRCSVKEFIVVE